MLFYILISNEEAKNNDNRLWGLVVEGYSTTMSSLLDMKIIHLGYFSLALVVWKYFAGFGALEIFL